MVASTTSISFDDWRDAVDQRLYQVYCITIEDAGIDKEYLINHWQSNEVPFDFVEWFANKFDLDPIPSLVEAPERGR
jgi:hypothetical protein